MGCPSASQSPYMTCNNRIHWHFLMSWLFQMGSHWWYRSAKSSLFSLAVLCGGRHWPKKVHLPNLSSFLVWLLLHRALSFPYRNKRPIKQDTLVQVYTEIRHNYQWFWHNKPMWDYFFPESRTMNQGVINIHIPWRLMSLLESGMQKTWKSWCWV